MKPELTYKIKKKVENYIVNNKVIGHGDSVIVGLSGGADSVCLFLILQELKKSMDLDIYAVHVNHGIRGESAKRDEDFSRALCDEFDTEISVFTEDIPALAKRLNQTVEEAGRNYRYDCFINKADEIIQNRKQNVRICLAHHMDDQAETVIFNMLRGSGIKGIGGMSPVYLRENNGSSVIISRPLLCLTKDEIVGFLKEKNRNFCLDETNADNDYSRNFIRNEIIAKLKQSQPKVCEHIDALSEEARQIQSIINSETEKLFCKAAEGFEGGYKLNAKMLKEENPYLVKQLIIYVLNKLIDTYKDITRIHIDDVYSLFFKGKGKYVMLPYNLYAMKEKDCVIISYNDDSK